MPQSEVSDEELRHYVAQNGLPGTRHAAAVGDPVAQALADQLGVGWKLDPEAPVMEPMNYRKGFTKSEARYARDFLGLRDHVNDGSTPGDPSPPVELTPEQVDGPIIPIQGFELSVGIELDLADYDSVLGD